jgi:hypothetical protein
MIIVGWLAAFIGAAVIGLTVKVLARARRDVALDRIVLRNGVAEATIGAGLIALTIGRRYGGARLAVIVVVALFAAAVAVSWGLRERGSSN